jgi:predicted transcriptional regulator of viral defense system
MSSKSAADIIQLLQEHRLRVFRTSDLITLAGISAGAAAQALRRLADNKLVVSIKREVWANLMREDLNPMEAVPHLIAPWPGYVSLYSALSHHGIIDEVPQTIYAVSAGRPARYATIIGNFQIHHLPDKFLWGFQMARSGQGLFPLAEPEKAFLDLAYLGVIPRSPVGMPYKRNHHWDLDKKKLTAYALRFKFPPLNKYLKSQRLWQPPA